MRSNSYVPGNGLYHAFDPRAKLVLTVLLIAAVFFVQGLIPLWLYTAVVFIVSVFEVGAGRSVRNLALIAPMLLVMLLFTPLNQRGGDPVFSLAGFTVVTWQSLWNFMMIGGRFVFISLVCSLLMQTTRPDGIMLAFRWFRLPESARLVLTLAMRFIPDISATIVQIRESQKLRLPNPDETNERKRPFRSLFPTLVAAIVSSIRSIPMSAGSIDLRGYGRPNRRGQYKRLDISGFMLALHFAVALALPVLMILISCLP